MTKWTSLWLSAALLLMTSGCRAPQDVALPRLSSSPMNESCPNQALGFSVNGLPIVCFPLGNGPITVLFIASIHGSEPAGTPLLNELILQLRLHPDLLNDRRVLIIPQANPDGMAMKKRHNAHGVDLNRNFPSENWRNHRRHGTAPASEPESIALLAMIESERPDRIISIHQPLACIDFDGPGESLALAMSMAGQLPVRRLGSLPGSLGSFAGVDLGIPVITIELPGSASRLDQDELWNAWGCMLLTAIQFPAPNSQQVLSLQTFNGTTDQRSLLNSSARAANFTAETLRSQRKDLN